MVGHDITTSNYAGMLVVSNSQPTATHGSLSWYNPSEEELKIWNGSEWVDAPIKSKNGINANIEIDGKTAKFKKGILTSYE